MDAKKIVEWACRNGYVRSGTSSLHKRTDTVSIVLEIKRSSVVMIFSHHGDRLPRIWTSRFKDLPIDATTGDVVLAER